MERMQGIFTITIEDIHRMLIDRDFAYPVNLFASPPDGKRY